MKFEITCNFGKDYLQLCYSMIKRLPATLEEYDQKITCNSGRVQYDQKITRNSGRVWSKDYLQLW